MDSIEAYKKIYEILDTYHESTGNDDMVSLITDMKPWPYKGENGEEVFGSADPAVFEWEWSNAWNDIIGAGQSGTIRQIRKVANVVVEYYTNQVGYDFGDVDSAISEGLGIKTIRSTTPSASRVSVA